ncbi:MAG TPA: SIR2 family protein [Geobacteraceae bacterium]
MIRTLTASQFASAFCLRPKQVAWFLGAGASASAGIPTGYAMIQDFKKRLFCQLSGVSQREVDANDPLWIERMNLFFGSRAVLPPPDDPTEYAAAFEAVYPTPEARRSYIEEAIRKGTPSFAHRVLASLLTARHVPCVFTTNFDQLVETATTVTDQLMPADERAYMTVAAIDNAARAELCLRESRWPLLAKLHGDFQSVELKNTTKELKDQDTKMRRVLTTACARFGLVVAGYSGRDSSVMAALTDTLTQPNAFPGGIFWVARSAQSVLPAVTEFLEAAINADISATIVESPTFDELAGDIVDGIALPPVLLRHVQESRPKPVLMTVPLPTQEKRKFPVLQCSAVPILSMPTVARRIVVKETVTTIRARDLLREAGVRALVASNGREIAAFGSDDDLFRAFSPVGGQLTGTVELHPDKDSWARGLIYDALTKAVCRSKPLLPRLRRNGHSVIVASDLPTDSKERVASRSARLSGLKNAYSAALVGKVPGHDYPFSEGVRLRLDWAADRWWCVFEPFTDIELPRPERDEGRDNGGSVDCETTPFQRINPAADWQRERWARRYNTVWSRILSAWANILAGENRGTIHSIGLQEGTGLDAVFQLSPVTAWCRPSHEHDYFLRGGR